MSKIIFIVDDNDANLVTAASALEDEYIILTMPSAKKLFSILEKKSADLILLDVEMPEISGIEAIAALRENQNWKDIPVIFLTSRDDAELNSNVKKFNVTGIIKKPIIPEILKNSVRKYIN